MASKASDLTGRAARRDRQSPATTGTPDPYSPLVESQTVKTQAFLLRRRCGAMVFVTLLLSGSAAHADTALASYKCTAPMKQREFATQAQLERYKIAVELYRSCLEAFVKEQETAIETHRQAAQNAIGDWNRFVGQETKEPPRAPEDKRDSQEFRGKP